MSLARTRTGESSSSEELELKTPKKPLQVKKSSGFRSSLSSARSASSPETVRYDPKDEPTNNAVRKESEDSDEDDDSDSDEPSSSSSKFSDDGKEVFRPLDERAVNRLPRRLRRNMRDLQDERMERQDQMQAAGAIRIVTPSDTESINDDNDSRKGPRKVKNDSLHLLNSMSLNAALGGPGPSRTSSTSTPPRVLRVINKSSKSSALSPESDRVTRSASVQSSSAKSASIQSTTWPEEIIPMEHWQNESDRIGLTRYDHNTAGPSGEASGETISDDDDDYVVAASSQPTDDEPRSQRKNSNSFFRGKFLKGLGGGDRAGKDTDNTGNGNSNSSGGGGSSGRSYLNRLFHRGNNGNDVDQQQSSPTPAPRTHQVQAFGEIAETNAPSGSGLTPQVRHPSPGRKEMTFRGRMEGYE